MVSVCLKRIEAFAGFVKLDLKIQGRRQAQPLACPIRSVPEIPHKAGRATLLLGIPEGRGCRDKENIRAACPAVQGWGCQGHRAHRAAGCSCHPSSSHGCSVKPRESDFSSPFISYKWFFTPLKDSCHLLLPASKICFRSSS